MRLALSGKFCSGKDSVAAALGLPRYAFADGMKDELAAILTLKGKTTTRDDINANKAKYRSILQVFGTEFIRGSFDDLYWIRRCFNQIPPDTDAVITDVRFLNEAKAAEEAGFRLVRLNVSRTQQVRRYQDAHGKAPEAAQFEHISETALDDYPFKFVIDADRPLVDVLESIVWIPN